MTPEPKGKLDAMTTQLAAATGVAVGTAAVVNGPEDIPGDWSSINWRTVDGDVRRLRQRIFAATQAGDLKRVRNLQTQHGRCPICGDLLFPADSLPGSPREWEHWLRTTRKTISPTIAPVGGPSDASRRRLTHVSCQRRHHVRDLTAPALLTARKPVGLA